MLPEKFKERMAKLLGDAYSDFERALTEESCVKGFRINKIKCEDASKELPCGILDTPLSYAKDGYILPESFTQGIGNTPHHHAGKIYVQDPGAMASVSALDIKPDMWIADLCAAPGGKSTQAASFLGEGGFILSNEYVPKRAKILVGNFERMGITCGMVTSLDTAKIAELFDSVFDIVIADAPCSGEGMFRKDVPAISEWSEENVILCAQRQREILANAAKIVKSGGKLLYSTCTYSQEENEMIVDEFLSSHKNFRLIDAPDALAAVTSDGISFKGAKSLELSKCRRFYPHISRGEGQFIALFERTDASESRILYTDEAKAPSREELRIVSEFFRDNLTQAPQGRIAKIGDNLVLIPHGCPILKYGVFCAGVLIGELRGKLLVPSHQFYSAYGRLFRRAENITDPKVANRYLGGEEIDASCFDGSGFCSVLWQGAPLGGGKASGGKIKNHYPKGLRIK